MAVSNNNAKAVKVSKTVNIGKSVKFDRSGITSKLLILLVACLVLGIALGGFTFYKLTQNDCFEMLPCSTQKIDMVIGGEDGLTNYEDPGVKCISFGKDITSKVKIKYLYREDINQDTEVVDKIDPNRGGIYYVVYTVSNFKYKKVQLVRNVTVIVFRTED